jgi:hypothetical protein
VARSSGGDGTEPSAPAEVRLVVDVDNGSGCPGRMAVSLVWDGERVLRERHYHEVESVRRCLDPEVLQPGWWEGLEIPEPVARELTGTVELAEHRLSVEVYNGEPGLLGFVRWGLERFAEAGMPPPRVESVTFLVQASRCRGLGGFAATGEEGAEITLCYRADQVCVDETCDTWRLAARHTLLHEYAHPWLNEHVDGATREEFMALVGLERWSDPSDRWIERGVERAANTIMFGLIDETGSRWFPAEIFGQEGYDSRVTGFRLLAGVDPIAPPAPPG